ncbi:AAA family ATPase [Ferruginibacter paludis]|uniref:AAA family ATPase n=1 Tax=Ferruginibacter paludis TaxID=1310417 RepID=UPI0025B316CA|nr:AAA family ATPase [Ferruginibacter paludis]MDN3657373.1 AAA family ATPase [Ferruginibacter paludis]
MIETLKIKNIATYDSVDGVEIPDLKKVNFFFGYNGSGKSTIVKYLYNLSLDTSLKSQDFNDCSQTGYIESNQQILVFDENFTEVNFNRNPVLKGVFSLNQANAIIDGQIANEEDSILKFDDQITSKTILTESIEAARRKQQNKLLEHCWRQRNSFATFTKISLAHSGSKPNNLQELKNKLANPSTIILTIPQLTHRYQLLYEKEIKQVSQNLRSVLYKEIRVIEVKLEKLLQEVIIGNEDVDIAALIAKLNARSWVETGIQFLDKTGDICPFCQQETIDENLKEQFNKYFDLTYKGKISELAAFQTNYKQKTESFLANLISIQNEFNPDNLVTNVYFNLQQHFSSNNKIITDKIESPNERKHIVSINSFKNDLSDIIKKSNENNKIFSELNANRINLISEIWNFMASNCKTEIDDLAKKEVKYQRITLLANSLIADYRTKILASKQLIETLRSQTINTREAVYNINLILKNTGFDGFEIDERNVVNNISQYYLKRQNATAGNPIFKSLSEGEKNFISFLYFFQLCMGTDDIQNNGNKKKIIVIDDPVSSLDSQALFVVSTLIHNLILRKGDNPKPDKKLLKNDSISQVFILTHNLYFYKEVSFDKRPICTDYWHLRITKINNKTSVKGEHNKTIYDDYSLLWNTIKDLKANIPTTTSLNIVIANSMRRVIESYVNFIGYGKDSWASLFNDNHNDPSYYIKCAFISTINDESHKITALDSVYYQKIINEQPQILFDVFIEIFKSIGKEHYELMMNEQL